MRKRITKPTATGAPYGRLGAPVARPVGFVVRFRIALAGRVVEVPRVFRSPLLNLPLRGKASPFGNWGAEMRVGYPILS